MDRAGVNIPLRVSRRNLPARVGPLGRAWGAPGDSGSGTRLLDPRPPDYLIKPRLSVARLGSHVRFNLFLSFNSSLNSPKDTAR